MKNIWSSTLREEGRKLLNNPDESLIFGGDKLHLSNTYREEHVTAWLCWILRGDILEDTMREKIVNYIFSNIIKSENYKQYVSGTEKEFNLPISGAKITLEYPLKGKYIDLLIESSHSVVAIENKIGDLNFKKNKKYKEDLDKQFSGKNIFGFLLLPKNDLDNYLDEEPGEKNEEKKNSKQETEKQNILHAFPPVTWEEFLMILRSAINHFNNDHQRWKHWKSLSLAFISFVEGNVLGYNFEEINKALLYDKSTPDYNIIRQINNYLNYRKDGFQ
ncbi:MAG: PD-(D/E)XK nuclease family protein [Bacteroidetes bacterium]|nr:PD-(D/E)XK nuclease family protein [Bacteroidota bacterium]